jgi:hypothetical protein
MTQFLRDQASDSEEVVTPLMLDGTYLSRNFATLGPLTCQPPCASFKVFPFSHCLGGMPVNTLSPSFQTLQLLRIYIFLGGGAFSWVKWKVNINPRQFAHGLYSPDRSLFKHLSSWDSIRHLDCRSFPLLLSSYKDVRSRKK